MKIQAILGIGLLLGAALTVWVTNSLYQSRESECVTKVTADLEGIRQHYKSVDEKAEDVLLYALISACVDVKEGR